MPTSEDLQKQLAASFARFTSGNIVYENSGKPSGIASFADVAAGSVTLAWELAAVAGDNIAATELLAKHKIASPDTFENVLMGAVLNLVQFELDPAFRLLDGTSTDRRQRAIHQLADAMALATATRKNK
jgi:hypothetical protein